MIEIAVHPCKPKPYPKRWAGLFEAYLGERLICVSRQPFLDAARVLVAEGCDPNDTFIMRHAGSETLAMRAKLGVAARSTVREDKTSFEVWKQDTRHPSAGASIVGLDDGGC